MRCALQFDESKRFSHQEVKAWGEMQSLEEEPSYKESEIKDKEHQAFFRGAKAGFDSVACDLDTLLDDDEIDKDIVDDLKRSMTDELAMGLFTILDEQDCEEEA